MKIGTMIGEAMAAKKIEDKARMEEAWNFKKAKEDRKVDANGEAIIAVQLISSDSEYCPNIEVEMI